MARRKPNVSPRTRPSQALKGLPPRMADGEPDFLNAPQGGVSEPEVSPADDLPPEQGVDSEGPPAEEEEPVLGEMMSDRILHNVFQTPVIPDNLMSDEPFPGQTPDEGDRALASHIPQTRAQAAVATTLAEPEAETHAPVLARGSDRPGGIADRNRHPGGVPDVGVVKYVQRVTVAEAYQFTGRVQTAPDWIDRNWLSFDDATKDETGVGIVLELPGIGVCRIGDYIVRQRVLMDDTGYSLERVAVYSRDDFEKMFLQVKP